MRIGIDIDDVITNTSEVLIKYAMEHRHKQEIQAHMKEVMKGAPSTPKVMEFCMETYIKVFKEVGLKDGAKKVINKWHDDGHAIFLITARGDDYEMFRGSEEITKNFLQNNQIEYDQIIFNATDKAKLCVENRIDLMIDDSIEHCEAVQQSGVKSLVFTTTVNQNSSTMVNRVNSWAELELKLE